MNVELDETSLQCILLFSNIPASLAEGTVLRAIALV
jgi:hypothetical protein